MLAAQPSCVPAIEVLAEALAEAGRLDEASDAVRTAMMGGEKPDLLLLQGEIELRRNRPDLARNAFRRLVEIDLGSDRGWASLGLLAARSGDLATARDALDKALRSNGMLFEARVVRAQLCLLDGQTQPAIQHLQRATQIMPDDPWAQGWLGMAFLTAGNVASAVEKLDLAVRADQLRFALPLAEALRRQGKLEMALQVLDRLPADEPRVGMLRARCLLDVHRPIDSERILRELARRRPLPRGRHLPPGLRAACPGPVGRGAGAARARPWPRPGHRPASSSQSTSPRPPAAPRSSWPRPRLRPRLRRRSRTDRSTRGSLGTMRPWPIRSTFGSCSRPTGRPGGRGTRGWSLTSWKPTCAVPICPARISPGRS